MVSFPEVQTRFATIEDVDALSEMINNSTGGDTMLDASLLSSSLFGAGGEASLPEVEDIDPCIDFDLKRLTSNVPAARSILAEVGGEVVAYAIYHYHYSPWIGHSAFIKDVYIKPAQRKKGIFGKLIKEVSKAAREEGAKKVMFSSNRMSESFLEHLKKEHDLEVYRNEDTDWSVWRFKS